MVSPADERPEPVYDMHSNTQPFPPANPPHAMHHQRSSDDNTYVDEDMTKTNSRETTADGHGSRGTGTRQRGNTHLTVDTEAYGFDRTIQSPSQTREQASRLDDDLTMLHIEQQISQQEGLNREGSTTRSMKRMRSRREDPIDEFDAATNPLHEKAALYKPPENPTTKLARFFKKVHQSSWLVRYFVYITPLVLIILIPLLLGALVFKNASVGGVKLIWFSIWLEIVWLTLWAGRLIAKCLPWPIGIISSLFTNNGKKWRDMGKQLELPATLFFWWLAIEISFLPTMKNHHINGEKSTKSWERTMNKVIITFFVGATLNFAEKIIIQLIAISFHLRTYADRIELNKFQIGSLAKLYKYSKEKIAMEDSEFEQNGGASGARTPGMMVKEAQKNTKEAFNKFGDIAGKIAGDFTGRQVTSSTHPNQVSLALLHTTNGSQILARRLYRTFAREETETIHGEDLKNAFENDEEADAAFSMFDKDMNGDISMEELEAVCVEIGRERKAITASLKDLDSVVSKLDDVFMFVVFVITVLVFISLISTSAAGVLTSAGSTLLALSWLFSVTAQEFLQSIIFVFVKHPFDVGDRVSIYGNTGAKGLGDDYFVKEIALLYTEFKKMEGHVVQAPNSYLNTLFILNQRRSGALAEAVPIIIKFGTTLDQIDSLRQRLLEFVKAEKREYQGNILTELREVAEVHYLTLNVVFFYKSNWQNELLRPRMRYPGQKESFPMYLQNLPHTATPGVGHNGTPDNPSGVYQNQTQDEPFIPPPPDVPGQPTPQRYGSILRNGNGNTRARGESMAAMGRRVDFSLGMKDISAGDMPGDVFDDRETSDRSRAAMIRVTSPSRHSQDRESQSRGRTSHDTARSTSIADRTNRAFGLKRVGTDSTMARERSNHRNRFFGRGQRSHIDEENGIPEIPEYDSSKGRLDPRTGTHSPTAMKMESSEAVPSSSGALPQHQQQQSEAHGFRAPHRAATDNIEMKRFH
ncbi:hypothetical protein P154DRAFT_442834 [Amniculicola lignicola CBS 123094]|uniref:EF-hand domain-containing protein n=1 Tax=Amniculicola lignicola CBS 123094 TaxID=1392246 RepID=A0A6A5W4E8_9PLEO|nr:hypothetical protein P154DRAFT_442834 [Amniculicola lignicola CBS 123094]